MPPESAPESPPKPPPEPAADAPDWLRCTACGYSLVGICTDGTPLGRCPECGERFNQKTLRRLANAPPSAIWELAGMMLFFPGVILVVGCCCCAGPTAPWGRTEGLIALAVILLGTAAINIPVAAGLRRRTLWKRHQRPAHRYRLQRDPVGYLVLLGIAVSQVGLALAYAYVLFAWFMHGLVP